MIGGVYAATALASAKDDREEPRPTYSHADVHAAIDFPLQPERPLQTDLDLHDPPQLARVRDLQLAQPLRLPTGLLAELVRERRRHPRQVRHRRHPQPQALTDVLERRAPAQVIEPAPRARRLGDDL